jgi:hypothetical protein
MLTGVGGGGRTQTMPPELRKRKLANLQHVPVLTHTLPVDKTCKYAPGSFPHFAHFEDKIQLVGGINVPKLVECVGSDGRYARVAPLALRWRRMRTTCAG